MMRAEIKGYEGFYDITDGGVITNLKTGVRLSGNINSYGYRVVSLTKNGHKKDFKVHRLLARAFIPNPCNYDCVNHKDGNKLNNSLDNLEWCSKGQNNSHARDLLGVTSDSKPVMQATFDGKVVAIYPSIKVASTLTGATATLISACCIGTAKITSNYKWSYAPIDFGEVVRNYERLQIEEQIKQLQLRLSTMNQL